MNLLNLLEDSNTGYDNLRTLMQAVQNSQDALLTVGGEPITLTYPEARFMFGKYKAYNKARRQEEFIADLANPVKFDLHMKQLRQLLDKQKAFRGSVPGERGVSGDVPRGVAEGVKIVDQDSDLDQQIYILNIDGNKISFTYWDYENNFQNPDIKDIYQQAKEQLARKLSSEQIKDVARAVFKSFKQGVPEGSLEANTPDPVVVIQDKKGKILDKMNLSVATKKYKLGNPQDVKQQLAHQSYTTIGNYVVASPMSGQPQDNITQSVKEELKGNQYKLDKNKNGKIDKQDFKLLRNHEDYARMDKGIAEGSFDSQHYFDANMEKDIDTPPIHVERLKKAREERKKRQEAFRKEEVEQKDEREYDYEGDMVKTQLKTIIRNAENMHDMLEDDDNLPEWVELKITLAADYIVTAANYLESEMTEEVKEVDEYLKEKQQLIDLLKRAGIAK